MGTLRFFIPSLLLLPFFRHPFLSFSPPTATAAADAAAAVARVIGSSSGGAAAVAAADVDDDVDDDGAVPAVDFCRCSVGRRLFLFSFCFPQTSSPSPLNQSFANLTTSININSTTVKSACSENNKEAFLSPSSPLIRLHPLLLPLFSFPFCFFTEKNTHTQHNIDSIYRKLLYVIKKTLKNLKKKTLLAFVLPYLQFHLFTKRITEKKLQK